MSERATFINYPQVNDDQSGVAEKTTDKSKNGFNPTPFTKKMDASHLEESRAKMKIIEANRYTELDYAYYKNVRYDYEHGTGSPPATISDVATAAEALWRQLETQPADLVHKAEIRAELEPLRKQLRTEPFATQIREEQAQEKAVQSVYIRARSLIVHEEHLAKLREILHTQKYVFFPFEVRDLKDFIVAITDYVKKPALTHGSRAARYMDAEIREIARRLPTGSTEDKMHQHLFYQTDAALTKLQLALAEGDQENIFDAQRLWNHVLRTEVDAYDTENMRRERRGLAFVLRYLARNQLAYSLYKKLLAADSSPYRDAEVPAVEFELTALRPGERMVIMRLVQYQRDVAIPRKYALYEQHNAFDLLRQTEDEEKRRELHETMTRAAATLATEVRYDQDRVTRPLEEVEREIAIIHSHWKAENAMGRVFSLDTFSQILPFWQSLESQHTHALRLLEEVGWHLSDGDPRGIKNRVILEKTLEQMQTIELHYLETMLQDANNTLRRLQHEFLMLKHHVGEAEKARPFKQGISEELNRLNHSFLTLRETFPSSASLGPYLTTYENYTEFCKEFEKASGESSPQATYRPPPVGVSVAEEDTTSDRGRE